MISWNERAVRLLARPAFRGGRFFKSIAIDLVLLNVSLVLAYLLGHKSEIPVDWGHVAQAGIPITICSVLLLAWRGVYRIDWRYMGLYDFLNIASVGFFAGVLLSFWNRWALRQTEGQLLILVPVVFGYTAIMMQAGYRIVLRHWSWKAAPQRTRRGRMKRTLIVGAGDAGETIVREIGRSRHADHHAIGFVDDDPRKAGLIIHGTPVLGKCHEIGGLVDRHEIEEILIAIPTADGETMRRIVSLCDQTGARVRTLPPAICILNHEQHLRHQLREVDIEDLLRREPAKTDVRLAASYISGETVLVTGAGGSIGSELARQIARLAPANLVLMGKGENSIYEIEQELIQTDGIVPTCIVGDVRDRQTLDSVFQATRPSVVFHAAAHKHVPLMQANVVEAIKNNIVGTQLVVEAAVRNGVRKFVYISTDKAVNPSSVMGATKRVGELIVRSFAHRSETEFAIVRFGNVLGSRGSLIPMLKKQIRRGGPIRITHPEMTRYFMTIPEAVQLIMQAGAMGTLGELFILDMGEPVKILDLAKDLVRLHGLVPGEDVEIQFTGVRPGEKTHEELVYEQEEMVPTQHAKIRMVQSTHGHDFEWLRGEISTLLKLCDTGNAEQTKQFLMEMAWGKNQVPISYAVTEQAIDEPSNRPVV